MKDIILKVILHLVAVVVPLAVAYALVTLFKIDNSTLAGLIALACLAVEKLIRVIDKVPLGDWVNDR